MSGMLFRAHTTLASVHGTAGDIICMGCRQTLATSVLVISFLCAREAL